MSDADKQAARAVEEAVQAFNLAAREALVVGLKVSADYHERRAIGDPFPVPVLSATVWREVKSDADQA